MRSAVALYKRLTTSVARPLFAIPLRLVVGFGFMEHGYAKLARGPDAFAAILHTLGTPALLAWITILVELLGGLAVLLGALIPLVSPRREGGMFAATVLTIVEVTHHYLMNPVRFVVSSDL
jgi:uncharacterized membrane protein YphA (DoxX/SURF4 family)